ncbi:hypothetical protein G3A43_08370 [Paraburkholderia aspalathi]|nr:hypothetical protein [Paraburkholderia aspalathi]MBK3780271.1 hypothetical protein [Paraburkholderia aspalathi]
MSDRMTQQYHRLMQKPFFRRMAEKSRTKTLKYRVSGLVCNAMLFAMLTPATTALRLQPHGAVLSALAAVVAFYNLSRYLFESVVLSFDLDALEAAKSKTPAR